MPSRDNERKKPRPLRALPIEQGTKAMTPGSKALHGRPSGPIDCYAAVCFKKSSKEEEEEEESRGEFLLESAWKLWTYLISEHGVDNLSKEGRALTVTNNYFWQPFNSQTYCAGAEQIVYGSTRTRAN